MFTREQARLVIVSTVVAKYEPATTDEQGPRDEPRIIQHPTLGALNLYSQRVGYGGKFHYMHIMTPDRQRSWNWAFTYWSSDINRNDQPRVIKNYTLCLKLESHSFTDDYAPEIVEWHGRYYRVDYGTPDSSGSVMIQLGEEVPPEIVESSQK